MKVLHISHHVGCMRDHAYIYDQFGFEYSFWKFPNNLFKITQDVANNIWNEKKHYFNSFNFIITSDTAPLSRIFMENINELIPNIIVWVCNRFDYSMEFDKSYYKIFKNISENYSHKFTIIPYSDFEEIWCKHKNIHKLSNVITPIGVNPIQLDDKIDCLQEFKNKYIDDKSAKEKYNDMDYLKNKVFIPIYQNDNKYYKLKEILENNNIECFNGGYNHPTDLKHCKAVITFPDAFSKLITFETIQNEVIVFLPSEKFIINSHKTKNNNIDYWFNSPVGKLNENTIKLCEWYRFKDCRVYFDSIDDLIHKLKNLNNEQIISLKNKCKEYGLQIINHNIQKWKNVFYNDFLENHKIFLDKALSYYYDDNEFIKYYGKTYLSRYHTFRYCVDHMKKYNLKNIVELGTSRSFVDGLYDGCLSDNTSYWKPDDPKIWDWSAGCFTKVFANSLHNFNIKLTTVDLSQKHINICKHMNKNINNIEYIVNSSENYLKNIKNKIDLLYLDTGDVNPVEPTAILHLNEAKIIVENDLMSVNGLILIDDIKNPITIKNGESSEWGKGKYSIPYFLNNGYDIIMNEYQVILQRKNF